MIENTDVNFGTDGIRGKVGVFPIVPGFFNIFAKSFAKLLKKRHADAEKIGQVLLAEDGRYSGAQLVEALKRGLESEGIEVVDVGVMPTGVVQLSVLRQERFIGGIMVTASHNRYTDNGVKCFGANGEKLTDEEQKQLLSLWPKENDFEKKISQSSGQRIIDHAMKKALELSYVAYIENKMTEAFKGYVNDEETKRIVIDCANGASTDIAKQLLSRYFSNIIWIEHTSNGYNINKRCGSTDLRALKAAMITHNADFGCAFDGDGDRLIMMNKLLQVYDGDDILFYCVHGLNYDFSNGMVITELANRGLKQALNDMKIKVIECAVGDRHCKAAMATNKAIIGGEASGHIMLNPITPFADAIAISLVMLHILSMKKMQKIALKKWPSHSLNIEVSNKSDAEMKKKIIIDHIQGMAQMGLYHSVRVSGTENKLRLYFTMACENALFSFLTEISKRLPQWFELSKITQAKMAKTVQ